MEYSRSCLYHHVASASLLLIPSLGVRGLLSFGSDSGLDVIEPHPDIAIVAVSSRAKKRVFINMFIVANYARACSQSTEAKLPGSV